MKYFIDFEFIEGFHKPLFGKRRHFIDMISVGIIAEDGRSYYAISTEFNPKDANDWVIENVISKLPQKWTDRGIDGKRYNYSYKTNEQIAKDIIHLIEGELVDIGATRPNPVFYGYYADYDWVLLCSLFGTMMQLPKGFPMYCKDLKQMLDEKVSAFSNSDFFTKFHVEKEMTLDEKLKEIKKNTQYPQQLDEHNALADAKWNKDLYNFLQTI